MIVINLKSYHDIDAQRIAQHAWDLTSAVPIIVCPSAYDLALCSEKTSVYAQHVDALDAMRNTGYLPVDLAIKAGAQGSLLNHSEHRIGMRAIEETVLYARKKRFPLIVCAQTPAQAARIAALKPYAIAFEPPHLIAGDISVSTAEPDMISKSVRAVRSVSRSVKILVGAGIKNREDVRVSLMLGAHGVLVASGITLAKDPRAAIKELLKGYE